MDTGHQQSVEDRVERIERGLVLTPTRQFPSGERATLAARLDRYNVPGLSVAAVADGQLAWARGYGLRTVGEPEQVTTETLFQAGSISKPVTTVAVLRLVEAGQLDLDEDVNRYLVSWKIPATGSWQPRITLRQLLSHTAGTTVHGFPGYARDERVPTLLQVLNGADRANTAAIYVDTIPGIHFRYSGGGTTIVQQLLVDRLSMPFPQIMRDLVLAPLGMAQSTYEQPLPQAYWNMAASGHYWAKNNPVRGGWHIYPEMAAAGLWTTPTDLARLVIDLQRAQAGQPSILLSATMVREMLTPQVEESQGLGFFLHGTAGASRFGHGGVDHGFVAELTASREHGVGAVVMTNGYGGQELIPELLRGIALEYGWPEYLPAERVPVELEEAACEVYVGTYELQVGKMWVVAWDDASLTVCPAGQEPLTLSALSETTFLLGDLKAELRFTKEADGQVSGFTLLQNGREMAARKM